jgi:hypothetical protein
MAIQLTQIPGFSDLPDSLFHHDNPALSMLITRLSANAEFGMVHLEVFDGIYINGDTVPLPISPIDGYVYGRSECLYAWNNDVSTDPNTGWITSGSGSLFFCVWDVDQTTGKVYSLEWYRNGGSGASRSQTNDGHIHVYTIAQRQRPSIIVATSPTYTAISESLIATDKALIDTTLFIPLNEDAKFSCVNHEVFYCGEFYTGQTIPLSTIKSAYDGYQYSYAEAAFIGCYRWTTQGNYVDPTTGLPAVLQPPESFGQMGPFQYSINATTGAVSCNVWFQDDNGGYGYLGTYGRIAVFAFCKRSATPASYSAVANQFAELLIGTFQSGGTLRASNVLKLKRNIDEALITPEFFGPTQYGNGNTVPLPVSPVDGYAYARNELTYLWVWADTMNNLDGGGSRVGHRMPVFYGGIDPNTGVITTSCWRLNSHYVHDYDNLNIINVLTIARRGKAAVPPSGSTAANAPSDIGTSTLQPGSDVDAYNVSFDMGSARNVPPAANESLLKHVVGGNLTSVSLDAGLHYSYGGCRTAPAGAYTIAINKNGTAIGSINFAASATAATFTMASAQTLVPGDVLEFLGSATPDAAILGIYFTISGIRYQ